MPKSMLPLILTLVALLIALDVPALARTRSKSSSGAYSDSRGNTGTWSRQSERGGGELERKTTWTDANGAQGSHQKQRSIDKESGTGSFSESTTGTDGRTRSSQGTITRSPDGSVDRSGTFTRANGQSGSFSTDTVKTETGRGTTGTVTTDKGVSTLGASTVRTDNGRVTDTTLTGPKGNTRSREETVAREGDTVTHSITTTNAKGETETHSRTVTRDPQP